MATVQIPDELHDRLHAIAPLLEAVLEESVSLDEAAAIVFERGLDVIVADVIGDADRNALLLSIQRMAAHAPDTVYGFMAAIMQAGAATEREGARNRIRTGFGTD